MTESVLDPGNNAGSLCAPILRAQWNRWLKQVRERLDSIVSMHAHANYWQLEFAISIFLELNYF